MDEGRTLPPGWEAVKSKQDGRTYYWNKNTGTTTWSFPEQEAKQHIMMKRRHTYENIVKTASTSNSNRSMVSNTATDRENPVSFLQTTATNSSTSSRKGYENVILGSPLGFTSLPMSQDSKPLSYRGRVASYTSTSSSEPYSPTPPIPDRNYEEADVLTLSPGTHALSNEAHIQNSENGGDKSMRSRKDSLDCLKEPLEHEVAAMGGEYALVNRTVKQQRQLEKVKANAVVEVDSVVSSSSPSSPPTLPLRAQQRMGSMSDQPEGRMRDQPKGRISEEGGVSTQNTSEGGVTDVTTGKERKLGNNVVLDMGDNHTPSPTKDPSETSTTYPVVRLDPVNGKLGVEDEEAPRSISPQPYEVASPCRVETPDQNPITSHPDPHYEEIEGAAEESGDGYMKVEHNRVRPRGLSSPLSPSATYSPSWQKERHFSVQDQSRRSPSPCLPLPGETGGDSTYALPSNSRKLQALNVTLRRGEQQTPQDYAKLPLSKEAILLRSGVTLRRNYRESLSSVSSIFSQPDREEDEASDRGTSDEEESLEPINKCIKSLESSLANSDSPEAAEYFKLVRPPAGPPLWMNFKRNPHAYEEVMGASQEELDWDESDMGGTTSSIKDPSRNEEENEGPCELVKVSENSPSRLRGPKMRVVNHQYEEVEIGEGPGTRNSASDKPTLKEGWVEEGIELPNGWQQLRDEQQREYYWHIPTGRTQYSPPTSTTPTSSHQHSSSPPSQQAPSAPTFPAHYLGCLPVAEDKLVTGHCVKAVHACISKMTAHSNQILNKGEAVFLQVKGLELRWINPETSATRIVQPINRIRVWGIGLDNDRDFGYVSRDLSTRMHQCHIFRCGMPARAIARELLESYQRERQSRRRSQTNAATPSLSSQSSKGRDPSNHPLLPANRAVAQPQARHERYERLACVYIGSCDVARSQGMEVLNDAVEMLSKLENQWENVVVDVAISSITIADFKTGRVLKQHRMRYLSFLGIARDDSFCGYILDSGEKKGQKCFRFHGFRIEPNTDRLCLALHTACQARYRRVVDSNIIRHGNQQQPSPPPPPPPHQKEKTRSRSATSLFGRLGSIKKTNKVVGEEIKKFIVQYLGYRAVSRVDGLDTVRPVVQELAILSRDNSPHMVDFDVSSTGLSITDSQTRLFPRKDFPVKSITYVVKIRNYFAFVAKDGIKYVCHVFLESKVDAGTIVNTVQQMLVPDSAKQSTQHK